MPSLVATTSALARNTSAPTIYFKSPHKNSIEQIKDLRIIRVDH